MPPWLDAESVKRGIISNLNKPFPSLSVGWKYTSVSNFTTLVPSGDSSVIADRSGDIRADLRADLRADIRERFILLLLCIFAVIFNPYLLKDPKLFERLVRDRDLLNMCFLCVYFDRGGCEFIMYIISILFILLCVFFVATRYLFNHNFNEPIMVWDFSF
jgi:hypothetical protein